MNVPISRRDFGRIKVVRSTWGRAHKDSIRATLVSGRGASTSREKPVRNCSGDTFRNSPCILFTKRNKTNKSMGIRRVTSIRLGVGEGDYNVPGLASSQSSQAILCVFGRDCRLGQR
eukprot:1141794-Pelagomonas_calceolata.AAC.1